VEIRNTIASFEEASPLFGFLRYRRRNVVIKYVPEECSRLVQGKPSDFPIYLARFLTLSARATVHFNAVTERFSPHDTLFPIASSKELKDSTLSAACSLHTASGSTSSSTSSLRRRRLMEIAEDAEEDLRAKRHSTVPEERPSTAKAPSITDPSIMQSSPPGLPESTSFQSILSEGEANQPVRPHSPTKTIDEPRKSSQSTRPELSSYSSYGSNGKPKIKLGPRPSLDVGRPRTSGAASHYRPVSSLPAGLKLFSRASKGRKDRPKSQFPAEPPSMTVLPAAPSLPSPGLHAPRPHTSGGRPSSSSGASITPFSVTSIIVPKTPSITPEKARLMKALELRKKQMSNPSPVVLTEPLSSLTSDGLTNPTTESPMTSSATPQEVHDTLVMLHDMSKEEDSGISFDANSTLKTDESDATRSDSYPVSPIGPSEHADSTRASSISESTDETVQEGHNSIAEPQKAKESPDDIQLKSSPNLTPTQISAESSSNTEHPSINDLPHLLPITYEPLLSPINIPEICRLQPEQAQTKEDEDEDELRVGQEEEMLAEPQQESSAPSTSETAKLTLSSDTQEIKLEKVPVEPEQVEVVIDEVLTEGLPQDSLPKDVPEPTLAQIEVREWKVPRSKFSVQDLKTVPKADHVSNHLSMEAINRAASRSPVEVTLSADVERPLDETTQEQSNLPSKQKKRKAMINPIRTDIDSDRVAANSDDNISSDDDLMDELQSAVFQEAQPMTVSKSPVSPVFPSPKKQEGNRFSRIFSNPMQSEKKNTQLLSPPVKAPMRSTSAGAAYLSHISERPASPLVKKVSLGSGISQRIKALEKLQGSGASAVPPASPSPGVPSGFFAVRQGSGKSPSIAERANSLNRNTPSPSVSRDSSPETFKIRDRSGSIRNRLDTFNAASPAITSQLHKSRPETISVTARIIRDPGQSFSQKPDVGKDQLEYTPLDLKQSPLVINHQKAVNTPPKETLLERRLSNSSRTSKSTATTTARERRSSLTIVKDLLSQGRNSFSERRRSITIEPSTSSPSVLSPALPPSTHANASPGFYKTLSISSRRSSFSRDANGTFSPPPTARSSSSTGTTEEREKKSSRASRMLKRMSSSISSSRKTAGHAISPTVREESEPLSSPSGPSFKPATTDLGDVNVQFPDTLLWKRRSMILDSQGYLVVSPALTAHGNDRDKANTGAVRRYHLSEFRNPVIPDVEMQELPNSVVLDFIEGGGLQVACEDRGGQKEILSSKLSQAMHKT
jgi:hypothetical protein